jgi:molybdate transport system substrate-binding protein
MKPLLRSLLLAVTLTVSSLTAAPAETVRVSAASSLTEAFQNMATLYRKQNPGDEVELNFAGSQILRTQIEQGAPADVFASADHVQMDALKGENLAGPDVVFARNRLVVVTPRESPKVRRLADLARPDMRIVIADGNVPVGRYTTQALGKMNRAALFGDDFQKRVMANVVSQETNVRAVLAKVSLDAVDAGIVYATDAQTVSDKVLVLGIPDSMNVVAEYPIAVLAKAAAASGAARFQALVLSEAGQAILAKRGFAPAR